MAYVNEENAGFWTTDVSFGASSKQGAIGSTHQRIVDRKILAVAGHITPIARPARMIDARCVLRALELSAGDAVNAAPANCTTSFREANGTGAGSIIVGPMVPANVDITTGNAEEAVGEYEYLFKGDVLVFTVTM